ncbi:EamA family transporter [Dechloromonas sp. TW-R-39-2]|uniref:DMT family transporter n=1 Tax=Dechloromonas sp. TW-R-39-2 TaxID=2654218 RepID=UPI00193D47A9|nr:DMT family transporter [Dechloromonas sp. TW-R-39-2]QRM18293.1 EamA family transporter [Dechloromonas sp. TW-R-39-2]
MPQQAGSITYLKLVGAMFMWGGTWIAGRIVAQELPAPLMAAAFRFLLAGLVLAGYALLSEGRIPRLQSSGEWGSVTGLALTGIFIYALCFFYGLKHIPAGRGALVVALNPVVAALAAWFLGQERMTPVKLAGIGIALAGCLTVIGNGDPFALLHGAVGLGEWLIIGCVLCWTVYTFIGRRATRTISPLGATLYASLIGAALLGTTAMLQGGIELSEWSWRVWSSIAFLAIGGTALGFTWFADGVKRLGAAKASAFVNLVPVFAVLQAALLLDERLGIAVLGGGLLVIAGVWLTTIFSERTA